jgi:hypothetical protein
MKVGGYAQIVEMMSKVNRMMMMQASILEQIVGRMWNRTPVNRMRNEVGWIMMVISHKCAR